MSILVGIAGGSGSGKTSFTAELLRRLGAERCLILAQDSYYKDGSALTPEVRGAINYDHPDAFDTSLLVQDLRDLKAGRPVPCLAYDTRPAGAACSPTP
jgi:uridine kinase